MMIFSSKPNVSSRLALNPSRSLYYKLNVDRALHYRCHPGSGHKSLKEFNTNLENEILALQQ
jgi:hypothetical protein